MKNFSFIILITLVLISCKTENNSKKELVNDDELVSVIESKNFNPIDSLDLTINELEILSSMEKLKLIVDSIFSYRSENMSKTFSNKDSIMEFQYIKGFFDVDLIDSIEFYRRGSSSSFLSRYNLNMNSLLILYSSNNFFKESSLDSLSSWTSSSSRIVTKMFKPGGLAFSLNSNICLFSINTCGPGIVKVNTIDSIIKKEIFHDLPYSRLLTGCGMRKMIKKNN